MDDEELARLFEPRHLIAELTSRCNLRCRYCQKALDTWNALPGRDEDLPEPVLDNVFGALRRLPFQTVQLSGIGEFTFRKDWVELLYRFRDAGVAVTMISNFARPFTERELDALLTLQHLMVSIDTTDAELLKRVRRSVSLANITTNLVQMRMRARKTGVSPPYLRLNAVLYLENMLGIEDLAYYAIENRVDEMQYERMILQTDLRPPHELTDAPPDRASEALRQAQTARDVLTQHGIRPSFHGDLLQTLEASAAA